MASPSILDFDRLLTPISAERLCGENLREDASPRSPYYAVKDARFKARAEERPKIVQQESGDQDSSETDEELSAATAAAAEWHTVAELAPNLLSERSKDLEVTAWLTEALTRLHGFRGLRDGFRLARELIERFWEDLYPRPDEDGLITKVAPLTGLNGDDAEGTLIAPIRKIPLTQDSDVGSFACWHYQRACNLQTKTSSEGRNQGIASLEQMERAAAATDLVYFRELREDLGQCQDEFSRLCEVLEANCGERAPPSSKIRNALQACSDVLRFLIGDKLGVPSTEPNAADNEPSADSGAQPAALADVAGQGDSTSREEALRRLLALADFFRRTEPHSPVSYLLEQAVRWAHMPLPELWTELVTDEQIRQGLFRLTGIRQGSE